MAIYENLSTNGHYTLAQRIFYKIKAYLDNQTSDIINTIYPVGCYFETTDTTFDPNTAWSGTTWELEAEGLVHVSSGSNYAVSGNAQDGGAKTINLEHSHTVNSHNHSLPFFAETANTSNINSYQPWNFSSATSGSKVHAANRWTLSRTPQATAVDAYQMYSGSSSPGTNNKLSTAQSIMQPYKIVNRWHRTA